MKPTSTFVQLCFLSMLLCQVAAWNYIAGSNSAQGQCAFPNFDTTASSLFSKRVVNGQAADITSWPWLVAILTPDGPIKSQSRSWDINCGGTLIHPEFVLTAAHCVIETENDTYYYRRNAQDLLARIGANNLYTNDAAFVDILVDQTYTHPQYDPLVVEKGNDLALLHLSKPFLRNSFDPVRVACLPQQQTTSLPPGSMCYVAGWGAVSTNGDTSAIPLYTVLKVTNFASCSQAYEFETSQAADGRIFCAGPLGRKRTDTCTGDSGGAIFCRDSSSTGYNGLWQLSGLVSFGGDQCAPRDLTPGVYTNLAYQRQWIVNTLSAYQTINPSQLDPTQTQIPQQQQTTPAAATTTTLPWWQQTQATLPWWQQTQTTQLPWWQWTQQQTTTTMKPNTFPPWGQPNRGGGPANSKPWRQDKWDDWGNGGGWWKGRPAKYNHNWKRSSE